MKRIVFCALLLVIPALARGDEIVRRSYPVSRTAMLSVDVPSSWSESLEISRSGFPPTVSLRDPASGTEMTLTPMWAPKGETNFTSPGHVRSLMQMAASKILPSATQSALPLTEIRSRSGSGFYFRAEDRAPKPDEFRFMAQGLVPAGAALLSFTIYTHEASPAALESWLAVARSAQIE